MRGQVMRIRLAIGGLGLLLLGSGTAFAQAGPAMPGPIGPNANDSAAGTREQSQSFSHVMNNLDRQPANSKSASGAVRKVVASDIAVGAPVRDVNGQPIGKVASIDPDGVVVDTGQSKVKIPLVGFGKDNSGLLVGITAQKFAELVAKAHAETAAAVPAKPQPRPATAADIAKGAQLRDVDGQPVGKITFVSADGATIDTGNTKVKLPIEDFGVDNAGLVLPITLQKLNELIAQSRAAARKK
jgi:hypothetical protein